MRALSRVRRSPPRIALGVAALVVVLATGVALAATIGVSSTKLTTSNGAASIAATTCTLNAANHDSYVSQASSGSNFGTATTLDVRSLSGSQNQRSFVTFSLAPCSIPANSLVTAASLTLFMYTAPTATRTYEARRVNASWTETGITWTNQPAVAASPASTVATGTASNVTRTWPVTADVQAFVDGTANNGWRIGDQTESSSTSRQGRFRSAEHGTVSERPILNITYYP